MTMIIKESIENKNVILALDGRLDSNTSIQLEEVLKTVFDKTKNITLDFSKLTFVASAGLCVLLSAMKEAKGKEISITFINISQDVMDIFKITGFAKIFNIK
jgi:anti-anti-sigma factor